MPSPNRFNRTLLATLAVCAAGQAVSGLARADSEEAGHASAAELEPVFVTAEKRVEKLQDIPVAATAITAADIENAQINTIQDAAALTPNLVILDQLRPGIQTVSFRGFTTVQGGLSPFATVVDGVSQPGQEFLKQQLVDVQQIEVLRGPQGTLYGSGAIAGAINIVTKPPGNDFEGSAKVLYGNGNQSSGTLTVSGPIIPDTLFFRASAYANTFDGLIDNPAGRKHVDFIDERSFNGELLYKPTERLDIDLRGHATNGSYGALWLVPVTNAEFDNFDVGPDENIDGIDRRHLQTYSAKVDYRFDAVTLTSITAYNNAEQYATADGDFTAASVYGQTWLDNTNAWSEELRLTSAAAGRLKWNVGAFAQDYRITDATSFFSVDPATPYESVTNNHYDNRSWAVFGQASYQFLPQWTATVGGRYDRVESTLNDAGNDVQASHTFHEVQPKASLEYSWTPDVLSYLSYSKGFRPGGFNPATPLSLRLYQNEVSTNYEAGVKSTFLDNRLIFNAAVFHTNFSDQQFFYSEATTAGIYTAIINIPQTRVNGAEFELQAKPFEWLRLLASTGYNKTQVEHFANAAYDGNRTPQVYGLTNDVTAELTHALGVSHRAVARFEYDHRGDVYWDLANDLKTPPKNFLNARFAYERNDGAWSVAGFVRNWTNERTPAAVGADSLGTGVSLRSANEPRQYGAEVSVKF